MGGLGACVGKYVALGSQMRRNNTVSKDFKRLAVGLTQLYSRSGAGLLAPPAGSGSSAHELGVRGGDASPTQS